MDETHDRLSGDDIKQGLDIKIAGRRVIYHATLPSTMDAARQAARQGTPEGTVVVTGWQTRGRGRLDRDWQTPAGNIALSIVLYPDMAALPYLIMVASLAVKRGIEAATGVKAVIKWPNDVLVKGRKVCGILIENELRSGRPAIAIVGIGINTAVEPESLGEVMTPATSLHREAGGPVSRAVLIRKLLEAFDALYTAPDRKKAVYGPWRDALVTLGQRVTVTWKNRVIEGTAEDVDGTGALLVRTKDGALSTVVAGDVSLRQPAP